MEYILLKILPGLLLLIVATITDVKARIIPNALLLVFVIFFIVVESFYIQTPVLTLLVDMLLPVLPLYVIALIKEGAIGGGDLKLLMVVGLAWGAGLTLALLILAFVGLFVYAKVKELPQQAAFPLAPFLLVSGCVLVIPYTIYRVVLQMLLLPLYLYPTTLF